MNPVPRFKKGDRVRSYGFGIFTVEAVYLEGGEVFYDLREVLSETLLKMIRAELVRGVPEKYVGDAYGPRSPE